MNLKQLHFKSVYHKWDDPGMYYIDFECFVKLTTVHVSLKQEQCTKFLTTLVGLDHVS